MRPATIDRYELREKLGSSATATVWRARDRRRRRDVALKVAATGSGQLSGRQLLEAEAEAAGQLNHPNIVPLLEAHIGPAEAALAFPLIEGETLGRRLARDERLSAMDAARIAADVATALAHAHAHGVIHRDVKPGNVLLGADGLARLFDFGISSTPERGGAALVLPGMTTGTLPYMAPEQLAGQSPDPATDVYALGVVLYEMLTGRRPYLAATTDELAQQQQEPPEQIADAPPALAALAILALDPDPLARPRASVFASRLRGWLSGAADEETVVVPLAPPRAIVATAPVAPRPWPFGGRRLSGMVAVAASLLIVGGLAAAMALALVWTKPAGADLPAVTTPPAASFAPIVLNPPSPAPAVDTGGSGGGSNSGGNSGRGSGHGGDGGHGDNGDKGDKGGDHSGKGKGH